MNGQEDLVAAALDLSGSVLVSGYDHPTYIELEGGGFERFSFQVNSTAARSMSGRGPRTEVIWRRLEDGVHETHTLPIAMEIST